MRSRNVRSPPLASDQRWRPLVLKGSFPGGTANWQSRPQAGFLVRPLCGVLLWIGFKAQ